MATRRKYTRELLEPLIEQSTSVAGVLRLLGLRQNGGCHAHISRTIKAYGLDTSHFRAYRPTVIPHRASAAELLVRLPTGHARTKPHRLTRALLETGRPHVCASCGNDGTWLGRPLTLDVDHLDGDFLNNLATNLRFLCPNCHRQTPNFAGRSRGRFVTDRPVGPAARPP
ncbi:HNH endonuclease signature motif containing protein [Pimelobacter simplex]|uniref:HNH endonuclease signature motif containing protein n=1 Tax=Nocardioides simplex TaxID=2045 RepID=UPI00380FA34A